MRGRRRGSAGRGGASDSVHRPWVLQFLDTVVGGPVVLVIYEGRGRIPHISHAKLDFGDFFNEPLVPGSHSFWCSYVSLQLLLEGFTYFLHSP